MDKLKKSSIIACANFSTWARSPRTVLMLLLIASLCFLQTNVFGTMLMQMGYEMHLGETMFFHLNVGCNITYISMAFLIMISDVPLRISYQYHMLIRSTRRRWLAGQLMYSFLMVFFMIVLIILFTFFFSLSSITSGSGWSDLARIAAGELTEDETLITKYVLSHYSPMSAFLIALLPLFFFWFTMLLVVMAFGFCNLSTLGILIYAILLVANVTILFELLPCPIPLPIHYATFGSIMNAVEEQKVSYLLRCLCGYLLVDALLVFFMDQKIKRMTLHFGHE